MKHFYFFRNTFIQKVRDCVKSESVISTPAGGINSGRNLKSVDERFLTRRLVRNDSKVLTFENNEITPGTFSTLAPILSFRPKGEIFLQRLGKRSLRRLKDSLHRNDHLKAVKHNIYAAILLCVFLLSGSLTAQTITAPSGSGTSSDPYLITSLDNLNWISDQVNNQSNTFSGKYFRQTGNINASATSGSGFNSGAGFLPIGNSTNYFSGYYNGKGHTIDSLFISRSSTNYVGLFGFTVADTIQNLGLTNVNITGGSYTGGLVGYNKDSSAVIYCCSEGSVSGNNYVGGLVGMNFTSTVSNSYSTGSVSGTSSVGGLVGFVDYESSPFTISNNYSACSISGSLNVGGLVGSNTATAAGSFWDVTLSGLGSDGSTTGSAGGTGENTTHMKSFSTFLSAGWSSSTWFMDNTFNNGYPYFSWQNSGGTPLGISVAVPSGSGTRQDPYLITSLDNLNWITDHVMFQSNNFSGKYFKQTQDIDASITSGTTYNNGAGFLPIGNGTTPFEGIYDGNGYTIDSLFISRSDSNYVGLFGYTSADTIKNLGLTNENITGSNYTGGLVGFNNNSSILLDCYSTGTVNGSYYVGGLSGENNSSIVSKSYSTVKVSANSYVGGLSGFNTNGSTISNSYSTGSVSGSYAVGGLTGSNYAGNSAIINSYSTGSVSGNNGSYIGGLSGYNGNATITGSFWDVTTSGLGSDWSTSGSSGGTGENTTHMKSPYTFSDAGWDTDTWFIDSTFNNGYPYLSWQNTGGTPLATRVSKPSGSGTQADPYLIANLANLLWLQINSTAWRAGTYFKQTADINASGTSSINSGTGFEPIGNGTTAFQGNYDGDGHTIDSLSISHGSADFSYQGITPIPVSLSLGLFGNITADTIKNLGLTNVNFYAANPDTMHAALFIGGLVGVAVNSVVISNCHVTGNVTGENLGWIGGIVGYLFCASSADSNIISGCYNAANVSGSEICVGGLVGICEGCSFLSKCYNTGTVSILHRGGVIGGLVGDADLITMDECYNSGDLNNFGDYTGDYYDNHTGGLLGEGTSSSIAINGEITITNSYNIGNIKLIIDPQYSIHYGTGGLVGYTEETNLTVLYSYSAGSLDANAGSYYVGSLVGPGGATHIQVKRFFWDVTTTGIGSDGSSSGCIGIYTYYPLLISSEGENTSHMKNPFTYTDNDWDPNIWCMDSGVNNGYPYLAWQHPGGTPLTSRWGKPSGSGTQSDPYLITNLNDLFWLTRSPYVWDKYIEQTADIDATPAADSTWYSHADSAFNPIGDIIKIFDGNYNGGGHTINGLYISPGDTRVITGMFGITDNATITNVGLTNENVTGVDTCTGGLAGYINNSTIRNSYSNGSINGSRYATGGLVGEMKNSTISSSHSISTVSGNTVGGLLGIIRPYSTVDSSYSSGHVIAVVDSVSTGYGAAGGFVGYAISNATTLNQTQDIFVYQCYSTDSISESLSNTGGASLGGFAGRNCNVPYNSCYCIGSVNGGIHTSFEGGFVGYSYAESYDIFQLSDPSYCYCAEKLTRKVSSTSACGFQYSAGYGADTTNDFWDVPVSGLYPTFTESTKNADSLLIYSSGGWGYSTALMKADSIYINAGYYADVWCRDSTFNNGYPYLKWQHPEGTPIGSPGTMPSGSGTRQDPYLIANLDNLFWLSKNTGAWSAGKYFKQIADIDAAPTSSLNGDNGFTPIGNSSKNFEGNYDGGGYTIDSLYIFNYWENNNRGFFGVAANDTIQNLGLTNEYIVGSTYSGGLAGSVNHSVIKKCFTTGNITGYDNDQYGGGLVGLNDGAISNSYSTCNMNGWYVGGLVGKNESTISNCYSTGPIICFPYFGWGDSLFTGGGLVSAGNPTLVTESFWDVTASGVGSDSSAGGTGESTANMKTDSTFLNAGWDSSIWYMDSGVNSGYPYLIWQNSGGSPMPVELTTFAAAVEQDNVVLNWKTATEVNCYGFEVEKEAPLRGVWGAIGFVKGSGNSNSVKNYSFVDNNLLSDSVEYRLKQIDNDGKYAYSKILSVKIVPSKFELYQNYPNPFNPATTIKYDLPKQAKVVLKVYNILGQEVVTLVDKQQKAGIYKLTFDASKYASGVYIYRLQTDKNTSVKKMVLLK